MAITAVSKKTKIRVKTLKARVALAFMALVFAFMLMPTAQAQLLILPVRVVFKAKDRMETLTVVNTSPKPATFRLSFYSMKQTEDGGYTTLDGPLDPQHDIAKMIVYSPRQVELAGNASQAIRFSLRKPADLPDGEYRVHLRLQRMGHDVPFGPPTKKGMMSTQVFINVGFSIPVIVRQGKYDAAATISDFKIIPGTVDGKTPPKAAFILNRTGHYSTLGKAEIFWTPSGGGSEKRVGLLNSLNVFAETTHRQVQVPLADENGKPIPGLSGGTFRVTYTGDDADKDLKFDEKTFKG